MKKLLLVLLIIGMIPLFGQEDKFNIPIEVVSNAMDSVGLKLIEHLKEEVRSSAVFRLTEIDERRLQIRISTMDRFEGESEKSGIYTQYCAVWAFADPRWIFPIYLDQTLGFAKIDNLKPKAKKFVDHVDKIWAEWSNFLWRLEFK